MVLHEKGADFETHEVDLSNKSEEFLAASPTGKVPVVVVDGDSLYESNVVNQYLDETLDGLALLPEDPKERAHARIWMAFADANFFPAVFVAGRADAEQSSAAKERLAKELSDLDARLEGREYLMGEFSLADVAYAGNFTRLRELEERGEVRLDGYPNVRAWIERIESRESYRAAI
jgi:glutathione S-transferase